MSIKKTNDIFLLHVAHANLTQFHRLSPWIEIPLAFNHLGYRSILCCNRYSMPSIEGLEVCETMVKGGRFVESIIGPFIVFTKIIKKRPKIVMISPFGLHLFTMFPLIVISRLFLKRKQRPRFLFKADWSLDYYGLSTLEKYFLSLAFIFFSHIFDNILIETYCGVSLAKKLPLMNDKHILRFPLGFPNDFVQLKKYDNGKRKKIVLCVARIARMKDQLTLVKAFLYASRSHGEWSLILAGPVEELDYKLEIDREIQTSGLSVDIIFTDFIEENALINFYETASIFCLPSRFWESAGQVKYEAIALGLPVISTTVPCREENEELGIFIFEPGDYQGLAKILKRLMDNDDARKQASEYSQSRLMSYYDVVNRLLDQLKRM